MIITIGGRAGSGKSTVARKLAKKLNLKYYSMGDLIRKMANERNISLLELNKVQESDPSIDNEIDALQKKLGEREDNFVIDSRLGGYFIPNADLKIFLDADLQIRAERIRSDSRILEKSNEINEALDKLKLREESEIKRYKKSYNFDCYDKRNYDVIINTTNMTPEEVVEYIASKLREFSSQN